jgi:outer membrane lipoprotein carrier protein
MRQTNEKTLIHSSNKKIKGVPVKSWLIASLGRPIHLLILFIFLLAPLNIARANSLGDETLAAIETLYTHNGFSADFKQISILAALEITETASGKAWFNHPGKMRWLYLSPQRHEIVTNGQTLWIYRPDQEQIMRGDAQKFFKAGAGGAFLSDIGRMKKDFTITVKETTDTHISFLLTAKQANPDLVTILIRVSRASNEIQQVTTQNTYGDTTSFEFTHIQFKTMEPAIFEFKIPEGSSIIEMD